MGKTRRGRSAPHTRAVRNFDREKAILHAEEAQRHVKRFWKNGKQMEKTAGQEDWEDTSDLRLAPRDGHQFVLVPKLVTAKNPHHPRYYAVRPPYTLAEEGQRELMTAWKALYALEDHIEPAGHQSEYSEGVHGAFHVGCWNRDQAEVTFSGDSMHPNPKVADYLRELMLIFKKHAMPFIQKYLAMNFHDLAERQLQAYQYIRSCVGHQLDNTFSHLDFEGVFFSIAFGPGSSDVHQINLSAWENGITWVLTIGDWEGGELCLPELGEKIPLQSGQIIGAMTRMLIHCPGPISGDRVMFTCLTDSCTMEKGLDWYAENIKKDGFAKV